MSGARTSELQGAAVWHAVHAAAAPAPFFRDCLYTDPIVGSWDSFSRDHARCGGKVALDVRDASGNSRWKAPRIYHNVKPGIFKKKIGCGWGSASTDQVYLCVEGADGKRFTSIRWRAKGDLDDWLKTKRLEMCLKGRECPGYVPGDPPE